MKRSMLLVLAGFGLASMLFALVAFVGEKSNDFNGLLYMRVYDSWNGNYSEIKISYPDGKSEEILLKMNALSIKDNDKLPNTNKIGEVLNKIQSSGYTLLDHSSSMGSVALYETYIFQKK